MLKSRGDEEDCGAWRALHICSRGSSAVNSERKNGRKTCVVSVAMQQHKFQRMGRSKMSPEARW